MMTERLEIYGAIDGERAYQDGCWNPETTPSGGKHPIGSWLTFIRSYLREAEDKLSRGPDPKASNDALDILRKIVGMGVACMEQNGVVHRGDGLSGYTAVAAKLPGTIGALLRAHDARVTELLRYNNEQVEQRRAIAGAARNLRQAQRAYLADRGNEELGRAVGEAAEALDAVLATV